MATIKPKDGKTFDTPILFNLYKETLVTKVEDKEVLLSKIDFSIRGQNFITHKERYYELLFKNEAVKILKKYNCDLKLNRGHGGLNMGGIYDGDFVKSETYFFLFDDDELKKITIEKASVLSVLNERKDIWVQPIDIDALKIERVEDIISLLK